MTHKVQFMLLFNNYEHSQKMNKCQGIYETVVWYPCTSPVAMRKRVGFCSIFLYVHKKRTLRELPRVARERGFRLIPRQGSHNAFRNSEACIGFLEEKISKKTQPNHQDLNCFRAYLLFVSLIPDGEDYQRQEVADASQISK